MRSAVAVVLAVLAVPGLDASLAQGGAKLPGWLDEYVTKAVKLPAAERAQLVAGRPVTEMMEADPSSEVAVFGAVWVDAPIARYVAAVNDIEQLEKGDHFRVTKKISSPPTIDDFSALTLPSDDIADLRSCRVGSCELKLSESTITRLRAEIDWSQPTASADVEQLARRLMLDYVNGYLEGGNARLATYRDSGRPTFVAQEFASMIDRMPSLIVYLPDLRTYLLDFPKTTLPNSTSFVYWQEATFGLKPTIRVNHLTVMEAATHTAIVSKMLYASHYFWTALELRVLAPDPARGTGFWFVSVNRSRSDGLSGFAGSLIRGRVRDEAEKGMHASLTVTKANMERPRPVMDREVDIARNPATKTQSDPARGSVCLRH